MSRLTSMLNVRIASVTMMLTALAAGPSGAAAIDTTLLHSFGGGNDGKQPQGALTLSNSTLYGTTRFGGAANDGLNGTIFKVGTNGNEYSILHTFTGYGDGGEPLDSLTLSFTAQD